MGFERNAAALLMKLRADGVPLGRLVTLGRQDVHLDADTYAQLARRLDLPGTMPRYADDIVRAMGASSVEAMDYSDYQGATLVHDLNLPVPAAWHECADVVMDGGTLEHVFNLPIALASCMRMLKRGGRFLAVTVANNWCGHGFYQFSPELFFRAFSAENGFSMVDLYVGDADGRRHHAVADPARVGGRVELWTSDPVYLLVHARRDEIRPIFASAPNQADYERDWRAGAPPHAAAPRAVWKDLPGVRQVLRARSRRYWQRKRRASLDDRRFFTPIELSL